MYICTKTALKHVLRATNDKVHRLILFSPFYLLTRWLNQSFNKRENEIVLVDFWHCNALRSSFDIESFRFNIFAIYRYSWRFWHSQIALTLSTAAAHIQASKLFILKLRKYKMKKNETKTNWIKFAWCRMWFRLKRVQSRCSEMISMDLMLQKASNQFAKCENWEKLL